MYAWLKLLHVLSVVIFLGNIITGLFWHAHARRSRDARIVAHAMAGIIRSDRVFTIPGVLAIIVTGVITAMLGGYSLLRTPWIAGGIALFAISGIAFMAKVAPLQRQLHTLADSGGSALNWKEYDALTAKWELWGAVALIMPLAALVLMVLKPTFG